MKALRNKNASKKNKSKRVFKVQRLVFLQNTSAQKCTANAVLHKDPLALSVSPLHHLHVPASGSKQPNEILQRQREREKKRERERGQEGESIGRGATKGTTIVKFVDIH